MFVSILVFLLAVAVVVIGYLTNTLPL